VAQVVERFGARLPKRRPYAAPERAVPAGWDTRADVFALATIASEMLGPRKTRGQSDEARRTAFSEAGFNPGRAIPVVDRGMAAVQGERYPTATAMVDALAAAVGPADELVAPGLVVAGDAGTGSESGSLFDRVEETAPAATPQRPFDIELHAGSPPAREVEPDLEILPAATPRIIEPLELGLEPPAAADLPRAVGPEPSLVRPPARTAPGPWDAAPDAVAQLPPVTRLRRPEKPWPRWLPMAAMLAFALALGFVAGRWSRPAVTPASVAQQAPASPLPRTELRDEPVAASPSPMAAAPAVDASGSSVPPIRSTAGASPVPTPASPAPAPRASAAPPAVAPPAPPRTPPGRLLVRTSPGGARVRVNGDDRGATPLTLRDLALGEYSLEITRSGYAPESRTLTLTQRRPAQSLDLRLREAPAREATPAPVSGNAVSASGRSSLELVSKPAGARVFVDGQPMGTTPLRLLEVAPGPKSIRLELAGHASWTATITVGQGEARKVTASLEPRQP
jgi:hypothetical protein